MNTFLQTTRSTLVLAKKTAGVLALLGALCSTTSSVLAQSTTPDLFVSSRDTDSIKRYNGQTGAYIDDFVASASGGLNEPQQMVFGPDGHFYVTGFQNTQIKKYDGETGQFIENFSKNYTLALPTKMTFHTDSLIYVSQWAGNEKVVRFDANTGEFVDEFTSTGVINGCDHAWDAEGNLYVASWGTDGSNGNVQKFDTTGFFEGIFIPTGSGGLSGPVNVWFDDGDLFVVDWTLGDVLRYDGTTGAFKETFISGMVRTEGFTFDEDGFIYLADWQLNRINRYDSTGTLVSVFANGGGMLRPNSVTFGPSQVPTSTQDQHDIFPEQIALSPNFPNPFNAITRIDYTLPNASPVVLTIYNVRGEAVRILVNEVQHAGEKSVVWDGINERGEPVSSGVYFYRIAAGEFAQSKKMVLMR